MLTGDLLSLPNENILEKEMSLQSFRSKISAFPANAGGLKKIWHKTQ